MRLVDQGTDIVDREGALARDRELVRRILDGDHEAFDDFFRTNVHKLHRYVHRRLRSAEATREVTQSAICQAVSSLKHYRGDGPLLAWLTSICRHEISAFRRNARRSAARRFGPVSLSPEEFDRIPGEETPELVFAQRELAERVHESLDRLPDHYAEILQWKYLENMSVKTIAERSRTSEKAAESTLTRARAAFRITFRERS